MKPNIRVHTELLQKFQNQTVIHGTIKQLLPLWGQGVDTDGKRHKRLLKLDIYDFHMVLVTIGLFTGETEMYIYMYLSALNFNRKFTFKT